MVKRDRLLSVNIINQLNHLCDPNVEHAIREFHQYCFSPASSGFEQLFGQSPVTPDQLKQVEFVETRFSHLTETIELEDLSSKPIARLESLDRNAPSLPVAFTELSEIYYQALGADIELRRPYPSGGALYAVESILIVGNAVTGIKPNSVLHYLPVSNAFEILPARFTDKAFKEISDLSCPAFYVLYCVNLKKSLFKYRSRGYRLSLLEIGSMYQNMLTSAQTRGISSRILSGFSDYRLCQLCGIDSRQMLPTIVQAFGRTACQNV